MEPVRSPTAECVICINLEYRNIIHKHVIPNNTAVHPCDYFVNIFFKRQYFTPAPHMLCRVCKKIINLPLATPTRNEVKSNSLGKEHLMIHHQYDILKLLNSVSTT